MKPKRLKTSIKHLDDTHSKKLQNLDGVGRQRVIKLLLYGYFAAKARSKKMAKRRFENVRSRRISYTIFI